MTSNVALIVVDMQECFCRPDSAFSKGFGTLLPEEMKWYHEQLTTRVIPTIASLLSRARQSDALVVFTEFGSRAGDGADLPLWARRHNDMARGLVGSPVYPPLCAPEARIIGELQPLDGELVVQKNTSGPLAGTNLPTVLRERSVRRTITTGVATNVCVLGMARELADSDFDVCVVSDACSTIGKGWHEATLETALPPFAAVVPADDLHDWLAG